MTPILERCDFIVEAVELEFVRGDANDDGLVNIADPMYILGCKFLGEACPGCRDAADFNDDGSLDITDAIGLLEFQFLGGDPPAVPGPYLCGSDLSEDTLPDCVYLSCKTMDR